MVVDDEKILVNIFAGVSEVVREQQNKIINDNYNCGVCSMTIF